MAFIPIAVFLFFCVMFFVIFKTFDLTALAMGGVVALLIGAIFARNYARFWEAVMRGIGSPTSVTIVVILLVIGMFSQLVKVTNLSEGFVWIGNNLGISGAAFTGFAFITICVVAMATGSSIGTMFTAFPIFYPAGVLLGADPVFLAGAVVSGAIFGDNLAPISDTTIISASSQRFRRKSGIADIAGVVSSRFRYALVAAGLSAIGFFIFGAGGSVDSGAMAMLDKSANPSALIMLVPVVIMLVVAFLTRSIFKAITVGLILGTITGLLSGLLTPAGILGVKEGALTGYLLDGINGIIGTVLLVIAVFGIIGVLLEAGVLSRVVDALLSGRLAQSPRGAEVAIAIGVSVTNILFGGVTSASIMTFGPVADEIGARANLHPYRRANIMDCFAMGVTSIIPILSVYLFIGALLTSGYNEAPALSTTDIFIGTLYPLVLTAVMIVATATGWGRRFEGVGGTVSRKQDTTVLSAAAAVE